jgi:hypothetical protein
MLKDCANLIATSRPKVFAAAGRGLITTLSIAWLFIVAAPFGFAQEREQGSEVSGVTELAARAAPEMNRSTIEPATLPSLDSIDAKTDITVFLRSGVRAELRLAALRRAWATDPAIRDFRGLQENDFDFNDPNGILGFGELGPWIDIEKMVAQVFGEPSRVEAYSPKQPTTKFSALSQRRIFNLANY